MSTSLSCVRDEECHSVSTCNDELPDLPHVRLINVHIGSSFGGRIKGIRRATSTDRVIGVALETNEDGILTAQEDEDGAELRFRMDKVDLTVRRKKLFDADPARVVLQVSGVVRSEKDEWRATVQGRIYTAVHKRQFNLVDADLFEMGNGAKPLELEIAAEIVAIKLELCFVYQVYHEMPTFDQGDVELSFPGDLTTLRTKKSLLALYAPKLIDRIDAARPGDPVEVTECSRDEFAELLYQIYQAKRPLKANFPALCSSATKFGNQLVLWPLYQEIINDSAIDFNKKVAGAAKLGLDEVVRELCYDAVKNACWEAEQRQGVDYRKLFGNDVYFETVCPAVIEAIRDKNSADPALKTCLYAQKYPREMPNFHSVYAATNSSNVCVVVDNRRFYVNRGVLELNGCLDTFVEVEFGAYRPTVSKELKRELARAQITSLEKIVVPLFHVMYGVISQPVDMRLVRPLLVFAHDHQMMKMVADLQELLLFEPVDGAALLLDHLLLAEKYELKNLERKSLWRLECEEFHKYGLEMLALPDYDSKLTPLMRKNVEDRICSGWSVHEKRLQKKMPTDINVRVLQPHLSTPVYHLLVDDVATEKLADPANFDAFSDYQDAVEEPRELFKGDPSEHNKLMMSGAKLGIATIVE